MTKLSWVADERLYAADLTAAFSATVAPKGIRTNRTGSQNFTTSVAAAVTFDGEERDDETYHSTTTNTSRITVPTGAAGWYLIGGSIEWSANATGYRSIYLVINGTTKLAQQDGAPGTAVVWCQAVVTAMYLAVGDYVELWAYQNSGATLQVDQINSYTPRLWAVAMRGH